MVLATQNPIEQEGTYALPEAQLDRFLLKVRIDYPGAEEEARMVRQVTMDQVGDRLNVDAVATLVKPGVRARAAGDHRVARGGRAGARLRRAARARHAQLGGRYRGRRPAWRHRVDARRARGGPDRRDAIS